MFERIKKALSSARRKVVGGYVGHYPSGASETMGFFSRQGSYDNNYPNITRIAERIAGVMPYAVSLDDGEKLDPQPEAMNALYRPNRQMSCVRFFKTLAVMQLVHPVTYLLVWRWEGNTSVPGGDITASNLAGFTFLEDITDIRKTETGTVYQTTRGAYTDREVIELSLDVNPYKLADGYSPSIAAKRWATVDDYIVDYQAGFFRNGAVPAGQFIITTATIDEFNDIVDELQAYHRGAGKNNNVRYTHRPLDPIGGKPLNPSVEWVPFSVSNKSLSLKEIFDQAERVRDMDFGVPAEVKGYLQNSNYASATTAEHIFDKYVVKPKLIQIWSDFTHELDRITGGLGFSISFDFEPTALADEQKVFNESKQIQLNTYLTALQAGFGPEAAIEALSLPQEFEKLGELAAQDLGGAREAALSLEEEAEKRAGPSKNIKKAVEVAAPAEDREDPDLVAPIEEAMLEQINAAIDDEDFEATDERDGKLSREMLVVLVVLMLTTGTTQYELASATLAASGVSVPAEHVYAVSAAARGAYGEYLKNVAHSYNEETAESIRRILAQAETGGWDKETTATALRNIMDADEWRVQRLARTETHRASGLASLDAIRDISEETGVEFRKTWHINPYTPNHCVECLEMNGKSLPLDQPFITAKENKFADMEMAAAHPNCGCYMTYEPVTATKSVNLNCPKCGRFLAKGTGNVQNLKCQRCKQHYDFKLSGGTVTAKKSPTSPSAPLPLQDVRQKSQSMTAEPEDGLAPTKDKENPQ